jgi:GNAT superfamily N-acetyltransferase
MHIRPIKPTDTEHYRSVLERTSLEDRYCRFFHAVDHFAPAEIRRFVELPPDAVGFIAEENGRALGVAHAFMVERNTAELAIIVAADARRRGVGFALTSRVIAALRARGCRRIIAYALRANFAFANLARAAGLASDGALVDAVTWSWHDDAA